MAGDGPDLALKAIDRSPLGHRSPLRVHMRVPAASRVVERFGHIGQEGHHKDQVRQGELGTAQEVETLLAPSLPGQGRPR